MNDHKEKIKVAVRIRPISFLTDNRRSGSQPNLTGTIKIVNPGEMKNELFLRKLDENIAEHHFAFDNCFWPPEDLGEKRIGEFATESKQPKPHNHKLPELSEKVIFDEIGKEMLLHAWEGYNIALLTYGQSGSGKSFTLWGNGSVKGLVSYLSSEMYKTIKEKEKHQSNEVFYEVKFGMLEIYNECMLDLSTNPTVFNATKEFPQKDKDFKKGIAVASSEELLHKFEEGMTKRAKYYSYMNLQSENGCTCVVMTLIQRRKNGKADEVRKSSVIHLIELPGKEKIYSLTPKKNLSKESSLTSLDKCINILKEKDGNKHNIKNGIGGSISANYLYRAFVENSKTFLIVHVTQDLEDYDTTLSALYFANEVQQLHTRPKVNEESMQKLIRDLKNENDGLRKLISNHEVNETALVQVEQIQLSKLNLQRVNKEEIHRQWTEAIKIQIKENDREIKGMSLTYEDKLKQGKLDRSVDKTLLKKFESDKKQKPHFTNLHSDPQINGRLVHFIGPGSSIISGNIANDDKEYFIHMPGLGIEDCHAAVTHFPKENRVTLKPCFFGSRIRLNGKMIKIEKPLSQNDRITFGTAQIWLFQNPKELNITKIPTLITYEMAEDEIFEHYLWEPYGQKFCLQSFPEIKKLIPLVEDANIMSTGLDRKVRFEIMMWPHESGNRDFESLQNHQNVLNPEKSIQILFNDARLGFNNIWSTEKFLRRVDDMKHLYSEYHNHKAQTDENEWNVENDPFKHSTDEEICIGHAKMPLKPLAYLTGYHQYFDIIDITNETIGKIEMTIASCDMSGIDYIESSISFLQDPYELIGKSMYFKFKILNCANIFPKYKNIHCRYDSSGPKVIYKEKCHCYAKDQKFEHEQILTFENISKEVVDSLMTENIYVKLYGKANNVVPMTGTKKRNLTPGDHSKESVFTELKKNDSNKSILNNIDVIISKKLESRQRKKIKSLQLLVEQTENIGAENIPVNVIKSVTNSNSKLKADEIIDTFIENSKQNLENLKEKEKTFFSKACTIQ